MFSFAIIYLSAVLLFLSQSSATALDRRELPHLSSDDISRLISARDPLKNLDPSIRDSHLSNILIPRPADTENNTLVRHYIISTMKALDWHVELDEFIAQTPYGPKRMANVIATKDPSAPRRAVLSAHFDSKFFPDFPQSQFVGATDSAMPCAMMLDLAETLNPFLDNRNARFKEEDDDDDDGVGDITLQFVFFDGEEAFRVWSDTDSIYGSRHLAEKWASTYNWDISRRHFLDFQQTELDMVEHFILLDLLGAPSPYISSYYVDTAWLFDALSDAERRLGESGTFSYGNETSMAPGKWQSWFRPRGAGDVYMGHIADDHIPFLQRGVPVLHIISNPFPAVWHSIKDDASALDLPTMRRWNILFRVFLSEYLHIQAKDLGSESPEDTDELSLS